MSAKISPRNSRHFSSILLRLIFNERDSSAPKKKAMRLANINKAKNDRFEELLIKNDIFFLGLIKGNIDHKMIYGICLYFIHYRYLSRFFFLLFVHVTFTGTSKTYDCMEVQQYVLFIYLFIFRIIFTP